MKNNFELDNKVLDAIQRALESLDLPEEILEFTIVDENVNTIAGVNNEDREKLVQMQKHLQSILPPEYGVDFSNDRLIVYLGRNQPLEPDANIDYTQYMDSLLEYMVQKGLNVTPLPKVTVKHDMVEGSWFFGKTAYYNPGDMEVVLYTAGRHPKDVVRSLAHEMIHHKQNLEGRIGEGRITTTDVNEDEYLREIEKEAYLEGNIIFREWTDSITKSK